MELKCAAFTPTGDEISVKDKGYLMIKKGERVSVPDICRHLNPAVGVNLATQDIGLVNLANLRIMRDAQGEILKSVVRFDLDSHFHLPRKLAN